jgi:hypothetical protein
MFFASLLITYTITSISGQYSKEKIYAMETLISSKKKVTFVYI